MQNYHSVLEMTRDLSDDEAFTASLEKRIAARELVKQLLVLRNSNGLSLKAMAEKMKCTERRLSNFENSDDADLRLGDLQEYLEALGMKLTIDISCETATP